MKYSLSLLILAALFITSCSQKGEQEYMQDAKNFLQEQKFDEAVKLYEKIAADFPKSPLASEALFEAAKLYQSKSIPGMSDNAAYEKAVESYTSVYEKYPDSPEAPLAMFMTGFLYANEMKQYQAAKTAFEKFLKQYPEHEMAESARLEIQNMGKSPEELLNSVAKP